VDDRVRKKEINRTIRRMKSWKGKVIFLFQFDGYSWGKRELNTLKEKEGGGVFCPSSRRENKRRRNIEQ